MKFNCKTSILATAISDDDKRKEFLEKHDPEKQPLIEMQTYEKWTNLQQGKIWRDLQLYGKEIFLCSGEYIYKRVLQGDKCPFKHMFLVEEEITLKNKQGKTRKVKDAYEKGLSKFTKEDCIALIEVMPEYLEALACQVYQEVIYFNWSCKATKLENNPFCEFTGLPFDATEQDKIVNRVMNEFDGEVAVE